MQWFARSWASGLAVDTVARKSASLARPRAWAEQLPVSDYRIAAFTAMLMDVDEKGFARYLADEVVRARFREPTAEATPIVPGEVYKYTIDLWATSNVFKAGRRIRVHVSSSNFPRFGRNLNTGEKTFGSTNMVRAVQTIHHDATRPSAIVLPVIPRK